VVSSDAEVAIAAAGAGAEVLRQWYGSSFGRHPKVGNDFATDADIDAELAVRVIVRTARPNDGFVGEELGASAPADRTWLVDPLCGTLNFAAQTPLMAVNVALRTGATVTAAASADPLAGEVFWTDGDTAWVRNDQSDAPLAPSADSALVDLNLDAPAGQAHQLTTVRMLSSPAFARQFGPRVVSTTLAVAWVAAGRRAGYVTEGDVRDSLHFAAGIALCQAAGCIVTGLRGQPLHTGVGGLVAAADQDTHTALIRIIEQVILPT
jgi:myo-inositol-1(or 4)-monophosphatase